MSKHKPFSKRERGQSLIEMGFSITVLVILLAGIVDLGRAFFTFVTMRDAAQEAAVYASAYPEVCEPILNRAQFAMGNVEYDAIEVWIGTHQCISLNGGPDGSSPPVTEACAENDVRVIIRDDDFPITMPFLGAILGTQTLPLRTEVTETILRPPQPCN
ncbi:MAG TPA: TadE family protein [Anaerolineaceae bacterium]|nr:TadE family protein [Anaerolineaceae bacterium]